MRLDRFSRAAVAVLAGILSPAATGVELSWLARLDSATAFDDPQFQKLELSLQPVVEAQIGERWLFRGIARLRFDAAGELDLAPARGAERAAWSRPWSFADGRGELELREFYVDGALGDVQLRLGKQQVVWGQAEGLRLLDVVNPFSYREFVLPDPEDRRIPLWTVNAELPLARGSLQLLWIPDPTYDEVPRGRHPFAITTPLLLPRAPPAGIPSSVPLSVAAAERPSGLSASSDLGARWSAQAGSWDLTLNWLYHRWDAPVPWRRLDAAGARIEPRYERTHLIGGSYASAFGPVTLRGEVGFSTRRFFPTTDRSDADGVFEARELAHVVGLDYTGIGDTLISAQLFQSWISSRPGGATRRRVENQATLLLQREALNDSLRLRLLWLQSLDRGDRALQAEVSWKWRSNAVLSLGVETFAGRREGLFGQFREASRATLAVEVGF